MTHRFLLLAGILAFAATTQLAQQNAQQSYGATISGTVTREGTSEPLADVLIGLVGPGARGFGARASAGADSLKTTRTDKSGHFSLTGIEDGVYTVRAELEGYFAVANAGTFSPVLSRTIAINRASEDLTMSLTPGAVISGRALDSTGRPALGSSVQALRLTFRNNGTPSFQTEATSPVDDRGEYRLFRLPPGEYYICLYPNAVIGRGFGARGARVESGDVAQATYFPDTTDPLRALPIKLNPGEERTGTNLSLRTGMTVRISGRVISNVAIPGRVAPRGGEPILPAVQLSLVPLDLRIPYNPGARGQGSAQLNDPSGGRFEVNGVAPGKYDLFATVINANAAAGAVDEPRYFVGRTAVDAGLQNLENLAVVIGPPTALKLHVTVNGTSNVPPETIRLQVQPVDTAASVNGYSASAPGQAAVDAQGNFTIPFLYEALYRLQVNFTPFQAARGQRGTSPAIDFLNAYVDDIRQGGASVYDSGFEVTPRDLGPIEVAVKTNGGLIDGVVTDALGSPQANVVVVLAPPESRRQNPALYKMTTTSPSGRFSMRGIAPGPYKLFAWPSIPTGAYQNPEFFSKDEQRGRQVVVNASSTTNAELTVISAAPR